MKKITRIRINFGLGLEYYLLFNWWQSELMYFVPIFAESDFVEDSLVYVAHSPGLPPSEKENETF